MKRVFFLSAAVLVMASSINAQTPDAPPTDPRVLLDLLKQLRDQNEAATKSRRMSAYQQVLAAAASNERAIAFWKEAVKNAQFEGAEKEGTQIREWREGEGQALNDQLCANAVRLHLNWLAISLQHAAGLEAKALLPKIHEHVQQVQADQLAAEQFNDNLEKAKDRGAGSPGAKRNVQEDGAVKKLRDQIARMPIGASPVAKWLQLGDMFGGSGRRRNNNDGGENRVGWEQVPTNVDGIYNAIILPEYRATKDPRVLEYWDMVLKRESDRVAQRKLDVEQRDWQQLKRPPILWARAQDVLLLGQRNRAIADMFNAIKSAPQHPEAANWISQLEGVITGPATTPAPAATPAAVAPVPAAVPATAAPAGAAVPPPVPVPGATSAGAAGARPFAR